MNKPSGLWQAPALAAGLRIALACLLVLLCLGSRPPAAVQAMDWPTSTPEEQGIDSNDLIGMLDWIEAEQLDVHSILVMRHGKLVMEVYYPPNQPDDMHLQFSSSKSFISALFGIAVGEGKIQSIDQPFLDYFPDLTVANMSEWKQNIHIHDLLNMNSGLAEDIYVLDRGTDEVQYCIDLPVLTEPGTTFEYTNCNTLLLSAILQRATGKSAFEYAKEKLFGPLAIKASYWTVDSQGVNLGYSGLMLSSRDMLKFGMLYNQNGVWEGQQVVPADWVAATYVMNDQGYGLHWWQGFGGIGAGGLYDQRIFVFPQQDIITVITAAILDEGYGNMLALSPLFAIRSDEALPASPASAILAERIRAIENPPSLPVPPPPAIEKSVSGKTIWLEANPLGWKTARLELKDKYAYLHITTQADEQVKKFTIGLDGVFRGTMQKAVTELAVPELPQRWAQNPYEFAFILGVPMDGTAWMKGGWTDEDTFVLTVRDSRDFDRELLTFDFSAADVNIDWFSVPRMETQLNINGQIE